MADEKKDCGCNKKAGAVSTPTAPINSTSTNNGGKVTTTTTNIPVGSPQHTAITAQFNAMMAAKTKQTCPKCSYWMALVVIPTTKEKTFICQNSSCKHSIAVSPV